jgi:hypothetical protein
LPELDPGSTSTLIEGLIATADRRLWEHYCRLAAKLEGRPPATPPVYAVGSIEWQQQQDQVPARADQLVNAADEAAGRRWILRRGAPPPFAGAPSPLGAAGRAAFDDFIEHHRGPPALLVEIETVEEQLVAGFEAAGRSGRYHAAGFGDGGRKDLEPEWFGRVEFDFANNRVVLPDGSEIAGIELTIAPHAEAGGATRERPARAMLREALIALWERGAFTAGTGNERVLALALRELGLSASDPPYGFKSAETVRKLRKSLKMAL